MAVRRESVRLELQDAGFSTGMAKNAAATALLSKELHRLDGTSVDAQKSLPGVTRETNTLGTTSRRTSADINQFSGRLALLTKTAAVLGPTLAPIGAVGIAGVAGLASQFGFAATGAISLVAAAQGVGDALKAVNEAALEPTAANLEKAREAMAKLGPDAQAFVTRFQEIRPVLNDIRDAAAAGWFPGLTESLTSLERIAPEVASLFEKIGTVGGNLVAEGAAAFAGPGWADFRSFVAAEAPQALDDLGRTLGNVAKGLAELWMAFGPLNSSFSSWMLDASRGFADWAAGLSETEGFAEFIDYVRENGPKVADAAVAIANAVLQIAEAAAPLGGPVLEALTSFANLIADIADSPLGTPIMTAVTAMSALSLATNVATAATLRLKAAQASLGVGGPAGKGKGAALLGGPGSAALLSYLGNEFMGSQGEKAKSNTFDINFGNASPINAIEALTTWDADKFLPADILKRVFTGPDAKAAEDYADGVLQVGSAFDGLADKVNQTSEALAEQSRITLGAFSATTQYREALKAAQEQANKNNAGIKGNSDAALENRAALEQLAGAWQNQRDEMVQAGKSTEDIERKQASARRAFIETATAMGVPIKQARRLANELLGIPPKVKSDVTVNTAAANAALRNLRAQLDGIRNKDITVSTTFKNFYAGPAGKGGGKQPKVPQIPGLNPADGGTIPWGGGRPIRSADGSTVPHGGAYYDRYPYLLAPGEEVISNRHGQADRHRGLLKAINAGMLADGGTSGLDGFGFLAVGGTASGKPGKRRKNESAFLGWDLVDQVPMSLKGMIKSLEESRDALQSETDARTSLVKELGDAVAGKFTSSLFGNTDAWSAGGSLADAIAILNGDAAGANAFTGNVDRLKALGLDDPGALNALLAQADAATIANIAATATPEVIAQYEQSFQARQVAVSAAQNAAMAAQTATLVAAQAATTARMDQVVAELKVLQQIERGAPEKTGHAVSKAGNKGAGKGARNQKRSSLR